MRRRGLGRAANMDLLLRRALRRERGAACLEECHEKEAAACAPDGCPGRVRGFAFRLRRAFGEELITNDLTSQFDEIKNGGDDFLSGLEEASGDEFEQLGIDPKEYAKSYLEGFDYKIGDVTVDEDKGTATAEVTITCKSMNKIVEDFATQYQEKVAALDTMPSEDDLYKMAGQVMVDVTKAAKTKDTKVTFKYSANEDNEWSADDSATTEMMNAMMS